MRVIGTSRLKGVRDGNHVNKATVRNQLLQSLLINTDFYWELYNLLKKILTCLTRHHHQHQKTMIHIGQIDWYRDCVNFYFF